MDEVLGAGCDRPKSGEEVLLDADGADMAASVSVGGFEFDEGLVDLS
jgi:hypothetical protein